MGISSQLCLAAWMPATWATASTSPFFMVPSLIFCNVSGAMWISPGSHCPAVGDGLLRHIHHLGPALFIEMGQLRHGGQPPIWFMFRGVSLDRSARWWRSGFWRMPCRMASSSAWPWRPRRGIFPAVEAALQLAVRRHPMRRQSAQKSWLTGEMSPTVPSAPGQLVPPGHALGLHGLQLRPSGPAPFRGQEAGSVPVRRRGPWASAR